MTTIKLIKESNLLGELIYKITDQDGTLVGTYSAKPEADLNFKRIKSNLERFGSLKKVEVLEEFTHPPKTEEQ